MKAGFQSFPQPTTAALATLTAQVVVNNRFSATESSSNAAVHEGIQHVIFIIKENRSYDQVLGDLEIGNGDPNLTEFGEASDAEPAQPGAARLWTLDNIMASFKKSVMMAGPGRPRSLAPDVVEKQYLVAYANRAFSLDTEGDNRDINVAIPTRGRPGTAADPLTANPMGNLFPGPGNPDAPDGPDNVLDRGKGYLWDAAVRAGLSARNYGFFVDTALYEMPDAGNLHFADIEQPVPDEDASGLIRPTVYIDSVHRPRTIAASTISSRIITVTRKWSRNFDANYASGGLPNLSLVRLMHDHTGNFSHPCSYGLNTPELQQSDNDYAVGLLVQKIANSIYAQNTLVFVIEDDSQDAGNHVDSHRTIAFVAGAYVKQQALVSSAYTTLNFLRTIEDVLGLRP